MAENLPQTFSPGPSEGHIAGIEQVLGGSPLRPQDNTSLGPSSPSRSPSRPAPGNLRSWLAEQSGSRSSSKPPSVNGQAVSAARAPASATAAASSFRNGLLARLAQVDSYVLEEFGRLEARLATLQREEETLQSMDPFRKAASEGAGPGGVATTMVSTNEGPRPKELAMRPKSLDMLPREESMASNHSSMYVPPGFPDSLGGHSDIGSMHRPPSELPAAGERAGSMIEMLQMENARLSYLLRVSIEKNGAGPPPALYQELPSQPPESSRTLAATVPAPPPPADEHGYPQPPPPPEGKATSVARTPSVRLHAEHAKVLERQATAALVIQGQDSVPERAKASTILRKSGTAMWQDRGCAVRITKSPWFEHLTLLVILLNAIWIWIDLDYNKAPSLVESEPVFIVADNFFCTYFVLEITLRFLAYRFKRDCLRDFWFVFDVLLVCLMVFETWLLTLVLLITGGDAIEGLGGLSVLRILRLLRLSRVARIIRAVPEFVVIIKGMAASMRSVLITFILMGVMTYVFAIVFKQLTTDTVIGATFYQTVPAGMFTLLIEGILPDNEDMMRDLRDQSWVLASVFFLFIFMSALTFMNMLIGFLCGIVADVSIEEQENLAVTRMMAKMYEVASEVDTNFDGLISATEAQGILNNKHVLSALTGMRVDIIAVVEEVNSLLKDGDLTFQSFVDVVLQYRMSRETVAHLVTGMRKKVCRQLNSVEERLKTIEGRTTFTPRPGVAV